MCLFQVHFAQTEAVLALPSASGLVGSKEGKEIEMYAMQQDTCSFSQTGSTLANDGEDNTGLGDDDEDQLLGGLSMFDKGILGTIWGVSFIYGILTEQVLSKKIDVPCSISDHINKTLVLPP